MFAINIELKQYPGPAADRHTALRDLRIDLNRGEFTCLIGPSGCGKSTLINIIDGLDQDYLGTIGLKDAASDAFQPVATVFQTPRLMPWLSVLDNVRLVLDDLATSTRRATDLLTAMQLTGALDIFPNRLSGGMQRRVALARAFAISPRLLLLDEPFVSLDVPVANHLRSMLIELWQSHNVTVLFVTHDLDEALALTDRVIFLSAGPAQVALEVPVDLPRPRYPTDEQVADFRENLLAQHPDLLSGLVTTPVNRN